MAKFPLVTCRACGRKDIDRNTQIEGVDYIMRSKNWYYHKECYENWVEAIKDANLANNTNTAEMWLDAIWEYLTKELKIIIDYRKLQNQFKSFTKKKQTPKGIYFALRYYYDVKKGDKSKAEGGIGIVPFVYSQAAEYWTTLEYNKKGIVAAIESQAMQLAQRSTLKIKREKKKKENKWDLSLIGDTND